MRRALPCLLPALCLSPALIAPAQAQSAPTAQDAIPMAFLRSFYKLEQKDSPFCISNGNTTLTFGPGRRELTINGFRCELDQPWSTDSSGEVLISRRDFVDIIDPILRPTYISGRREVKTIILDPAHGGNDRGLTHNKLEEARCTLDIARRLQEALTKRGYKVILTHADDIFLSDQQRVDNSNVVPNAIFVSLHLNEGRSDVSGPETYIALPEDDRRPAAAHVPSSAALAFALQSSLASATGVANMGLRRAHYTLLNSINHPSALVMLGYATNPAEARALTDPAGSEKIITALADGISAYATVMDPKTELKPWEPPPEPTTTYTDTPAPEPEKKAEPAKKKPKTKTTRSSRRKSSSRRSSSRRRSRR